MFCRTLWSGSGFTDALRALQGGLNLHWLELYRCKPSQLEGTFKKRIDGTQKKRQLTVSGRGRWLGLLWALWPLPSNGALSFFFPNPPFSPALATTR